MSLPTGPTDWTSGERVFAPPSGTLDADWLVPAVLEALPGTSPDAALAALRAAAAPLPRSDDGAPSDGSDPRPSPDLLAETAAAVVRAAREAFRA